MVQVEVNGEDAQYVWCRERLTQYGTVCVVQVEVKERMHSICGAWRGLRRGCTVSAVLVEVNGEDLRYVWCRESLTERMYGTVCVVQGEVNGEDVQLLQYEWFR